MTNNSHSVFNPVFDLIMLFSQVKTGDLISVRTRRILCVNLDFKTLRFINDGWIKYALCVHHYHLFKVKTISQLAVTPVGSNNHNLVPD